MGIQWRCNIFLLQAISMFLSPRKPFGDIVNAHFEGNDLLNKRIQTNQNTIPYSWNVFEIFIRKQIFILNSISFNKYILIRWLLKGPLPRCPLRIIFRCYWWKNIHYFHRQDVMINWSHEMSCHIIYQDIGSSYLIIDLVMQK